MPDRGWRRDNRATRTRYTWAAPTTTGAAEALLAHARALPAYNTRPDFHACAASAIAAAIQLDPYAKVTFKPSVRFLYYVGRYLQRREDENNGASIFATLRAAQAIGFCREETWTLNGGPYNQSPTPDVYDQAKQNGILGFMPVERGDVRAVLDSGHPVVFGLLVEDRFLRSSAFAQGVIPPPTKAPVDRHSLLAVGYDDAQRFFVCRDSLGPNRGSNGNINVSYEYVLNDNGWCDDFWYIEGVATAEYRPTDLQQARDEYIDDGVRFRRFADLAYAKARQTAKLPPPGDVPPIAAEVARRLAHP
jgi:hypothetical protein